MPEYYDAKNTNKSFENRRENAGAFPASQLYVRLKGKNMKRLKAIAIIMFSTILTSSMLFAQTKGINVIPIKDSNGRQINLYRGSHALVVGVSNYVNGWPKLPSVESETKEIVSALSHNGFNVVHIIDPDDLQLEDAFKTFINKYGYDQDNRLLFFFSGHGYSRKSGTKGYLVPSNAPNPRKDEKGFLLNALPMSQILAWSRQMEAKHALFLFWKKMGSSLLLKWGQVYY